MLRADQQNAVIILNLIKIDLEFLFIKLKNNKYIIGFEVKEILYLSENIGKPLNKE
jgi:hypothetical protein